MVTSEDGRVQMQRTRGEEKNEMEAAGGDVLARGHKYETNVSEANDEQRRNQNQKAEASANASYPRPNLPES